MAFKEENNRLIYKYNGGRTAILCSNCYAIIYEGGNIPDKLVTAIVKQKDTEPVFCCEECKNEWFETK